MLPKISYRSNERGAALAEMAIIAPLFATLVFGIIQLGVLFQGYVSLRNIALDGVRFASEFGPARTGQSVEDYVRFAAANAGFNISPSAFNVSHSTTSADEGAESSPGAGLFPFHSVAITYQAPLIYSNLPGAGSSSFPISVEYEGR